MSETEPFVQSASVSRLYIQEDDGGQSCACCRCCNDKCKPYAKNLWALLCSMGGIVGLAMSLLMFDDIDDILKCTFTAVLYLLGIVLSLLFLIIATISIWSRYKGCFNANPVCRLVCFVINFRTGGCDEMTEYREGPGNDSHVLAYSFLDASFPGVLIPLVATYMNHVNGHAKPFGIKIEHPVVLWFIIVGSPLKALVQLFFAACGVYGKEKCSKPFVFIVFFVFLYLGVLALLYGLSYGHAFDCKCPQFFNGTANCTG